METQTIQLNQFNSEVTLTAYLEPCGGKFDYIEKRPAVLILPGGGYQYCSDREADPVAFSYLKAGYQTFILRYSVGKKSAWPAPLLDYDQAMDMILEKQEEWHVYSDKICVVGFSAGGHLAAAAATMGKHRPNAAVLGYALTGNDVKVCNMSAPDCSKMVDAKTCPCFVFASRDDGLVPIKNSLDFLEALAKKGIAFESHIYSYGGHGFSTGNSSVQNPLIKGTARLSCWVDDSIGWLKELFGDFDGNGGMTKPLVAAHVNGDYDPYLSVNCTVNKLFQVEESRVILEPLMNSMRVDQSVSDEDYEEERKQLEDSIGGMKLAQVLNFVGAPDDAIDKIDQKLRKIKNPEGL